MASVPTPQIPHGGVGAVADATDQAHAANGASGTNGTNRQEAVGAPSSDLHKALAEPVLGWGGNIGFLGGYPGVRSFLLLLPVQQTLMLLLSSLCFDAAAILYLVSRIDSAIMHTVASALFILSAGLDGLELRVQAARSKELDARFGTRFAKNEWMRWVAFLLSSALCCARREREL